MGMPTSYAATPPVRRKAAEKDRELSAEEKLQETLEDRRLVAGWNKRRSIRSQ